MLEWQKKADTYNKDPYLDNEVLKHSTRYGSSVIYNKDTFNDLVNEKVEKHVLGSFVE